MYPLLIVLIFAGTLLLRCKLHNRKIQKWVHELTFLQLPWGVLLQPYTCFMFVFLVVYIYQVIEFVGLCLRYNWLDPDSFSKPGSNQTLSDTKKNEYELLSWVRFLCLLSPIFIGATFVVTVAHLWQHLPRNRGFDEHLRWFPTYSHDLAMQVVALPLVYGIFALDNVLQMLYLFTGEAYDEAKTVEHHVSWNRTLYRTKQTYASNFDLADVYEAWALRSFGLLCYMLVSRQMRKEVPTVQYLIETVRSHLSTVAGDDNHDLRMLNDLTILNNPQKLLFEPLQQTSALGVNVFVYTYAFKSGFLLTLQFLNYPPLNLQMCGVDGLFPAVCSIIPYFDGACFLASTLAILDIIVFERSLNEILAREHFRPFLKFLAVKVLVSIVFIQGYGLSVIMVQIAKCSDAQSDLTYAGLVCFQVLPLSILVFVAWRPTPGDWYGGDRFSDEQVDGEGTPGGQLANESLGTAEPFVASRQPSEAMMAGRDMPDELTAIIELRGDIRAQEGKALEDVINTLSKTVKAHYKPAALYRGIGQRRAQWTAIPSPANGPGSSQTAVWPGNMDVQGPRSRPP